MASCTSPGQKLMPHRRVRCGHRDNSPEPEPQRHRKVRAHAPPLSSGVVCVSSPEPEPASQRSELMPHRRVVWSVWKAALEPELSVTEVSHKGKGVNVMHIARSELMPPHRRVVWSV
ncbi:hypothetical protein RRG08_066338 [Elysia crispata]|uniref:Uncharacterized protein n=1 Tax=Elysia crispata TaxID=231223 RepID=A0AAE0YNM8_9GAST|nr:hypothetical protein RRG08_066338 [Elysia crispata]